MTSLLNDDSRDASSSSTSMSSGFNAYNMDELGISDDVGYFDDAPPGVIPRIAYYARRIDTKTTIIVILVVLLVIVTITGAYLAATRHLSLTLVPATANPPTADPLNPPATATAVSVGKTT